MGEMIHLFPPTLQNSIKSGVASLESDTGGVDFVIGDLVTGILQTGQHAERTSQSLIHLWKQRKNRMNLYK